MDSALKALSDFETFESSSLSPLLDELRVVSTETAQYAEELKEAELKLRNTHQVLMAAQSARGGQQQQQL